MGLKLTDIKETEKKGDFILAVLRIKNVVIFLFDNFHKDGNRSFLHIEW